MKYRFWVRFGVRCACIAAISPFLAQGGGASGVLQMALFLLGLSYSAEYVLLAARMLLGKGVSYGFAALLFRSVVGVIVVAVIVTLCLTIALIVLSAVGYINMIRLYLRARWLDQMN